MTIQPIHRQSAGEITTFFRTVFTESAGETEGESVANLAADILVTATNDELHGFVTHDDAQNFTGCILFTRLYLPENTNAFLLSPVAIATSEQGKGIGQQLIQHGLQALREQDTQLVFTYGDPNYYRKVGFASVDESVIAAPQPLSYPNGWLAQSLIDQPISTMAGKMRCVEAFNRPDIW